MLTRALLEAERKAILDRIAKVEADLYMLKGALQFCDFTLENIDQPTPESSPDAPAPGPVGVVEEG